MPAEALPGLWRSFRLPTVASIWEASVARAEPENWGYRRRLQHLFESEAQDRRERKMTRLLKASGLPDGKTLGNLDEQRLTTKIRRLWPTLLEGHFVERAENLIAIGLPGRVGARADPASPDRGALRAHVQTGAGPFGRQEGAAFGGGAAAVGSGSGDRPRRFWDREEMEVLFTFLAERYERRSVLIRTNLVFSRWEQLFKDPMTTMAAVDRLGHHATILEFTGESIRAQKATEKKTA